MKLTCDLIKYVRTSEDKIMRVDALILRLSDLDKVFNRGSIFLITENHYIPVEQRFADEHYMLTTSLGTNQFTWMSLSGYHSGDRTLLSFEPDIGTAGISSIRLLKGIEEFYGSLHEERGFDRDSVYYVDGILEITRS
ncbi:MAG TPA: hypothetical protein VE954_17955 [Oligoflexus sp.]|uniref:hypothetical protein n=1 Tax=Oligoflexus sp. TaxID=1971216 RepID=UPI002D54A8A4|nr:hypothetical protein [Oligoflexus sp.]HYX34984.1 hypothetical protein [Oligoflexus sp.]